ncbi:MAG: GNAT family N-acetyltransferase [Flavobacteriales bacterium]
MKLEHTNLESKGFFRVIDNSVEAGKMTYSWAGKDKFIIDHTEVSQAYNGKDVGKMMVMEAVKFARENDIKIIPLCPFAKSVFLKQEGLTDVLA